METPPPETEMVLLGTHRFVVSVHTGDHKGDDIKANDIRSNVYIQLCDAVGFSTPAYHLPFVGDVQQWSVSRYALPDEPMLTDIDNILLRRDEADIGDAWLIYLVEVDDRQYQRKYVFPVHRWLEVDTAYRLRQYDMSLPQDDDPGMVTSRRLETVTKRKHYLYAQFIGDGPATIKDMPDEEYFSFMDEYWFEKEVKLLRRQRTPDDLSTDKWTSFTEMMESCRKTYGETIAMEHWNTDRWFGVQRLQGVNAGLITLCTTIPDKLGVDVGMMSPFLEGFTLDEAIKRSRIFMVDLHILDGISPVEGSSKHLCSPIALFFLNKAGHLMPVAIQLFQKATHHNPAFLPSDPPNLWLLAKMFYNNAEAQHHQACTNLGLTRLLMEGVVVCTNRNLGPSHPLFRLLAPHFLYLVAINEATVIQLLKTGSWLFKLLTAGEGGLQELIKRGLQGWRLDTCGVVPRQVAGRGVADDTVLPYYPYRDDACALVQQRG